MMYHPFKISPRKFRVVLKYETKHNTSKITEGVHLDKNLIEK